MTCAIGAEIHKDHLVAGCKGCAITNKGRCNKLVIFVPGIGRFQRLNGVLRLMLCLPVHHHVKGDLDAFPTVVPVHGEVATTHTGNGSIALA